MPDRVAVEELHKALDEIFRYRDHATRRDLYAAASAHVRLSSDMLALLNELPEHTYSRAELVEAIRRVLEAHGGQADLDMLEQVPNKAVENTDEAARAVEDDAPLDSLRTGPADPRYGAPEFREPGV